MATTSIDTGNIYIAKLHDGSGNPLKVNGSDAGVSGNTITHNANECVQIQTTKMDYNYDDNLMKLPIPVSKSNRPEGDSFSRIIDLKRINESIAVQGFLIEEVDSRAITKRDNLITLAKTGDALTVVWGQGNYQTLWTPTVIPYGVFIQKIGITETAGLIGTGFTGDAPPERSLAIQIMLVRGKDM